MSTDRTEWLRITEAKKVTDDEQNDRWHDYWKEQEEIRKHLDALRLKIILGDKLIPLAGWNLEQPSGHERLIIRHEEERDHIVWKLLFEFWPDADYHAGMAIKGEEYGEGVVLRTDDDEMSMQFTPAPRLPEFVKAYGLVVNPGDVGEYREGLVKALAGVDKLLEVLK